MTFHRLAAAAAAMVLLVPLPALAGETVVHVDLLSAPEEAPQSHQDKVRGASSDAEPMGAVLAPVAGAERLPLTVRTADTLGPAYRIVSVELRTGPESLGTIRDFDAKPRARKQLTERLSTTVDSRWEKVGVVVIVRGVGSGEFAWLNDYRITMTGPCAITTRDGNATVDVTVERDAGPFADFDEGLVLRCGD